MASGNPQLVLDEGLFLGATRTLAELEDRGDKFELVNAVRDFSRSERVTERFSTDVGREISREAQDAIDYYVAAVHLVYSHHANLDQLPEVIEEHDDAARDFIRSAAWAYLSAWSLRYGGALSWLIGERFLVDPSRR